MRVYSIDSPPLFKIIEAADKRLDARVKGKNDEKIQIGLRARLTTTAQRSTVPSVVIPAWQRIKNKYLIIVTE